MNEDRHVIGVLRSLPDGARTLDPSPLIAAAKRRRGRNRALAGVVVLSVAVATVGGVVVGRGIEDTGPETKVAGGGSSAGLVPTTSVDESGYRFGNEPHGVKTLPAGERVQIGRYRWFETKGTQWAVIEEVPGQPANLPFGWRDAVDDRSLGDPIGSATRTSIGSVYVMVIKRSDVSRVVYAVGMKAYNADVYRLGGIPGFVAATVELPEAASGKSGQATAVFVYDRKGKVLDQFPAAAKNPLR